MPFFQPPTPGEVLFEVRAQLLRPVLLGTAVFSVAYLGLGWFVSAARSPYYPADALAVVLLCAVCGGLMWFPRWGVQAAAAFFLAGISQPFFYASQIYGVASPVNAVFIIGLLLCGLLIGGWFLGAWTLGYCAWMLMAAWGEWNGRWGVSRDAAGLTRMVVFWWVTFGGAGWLIGLFARTLERSAHIARGHTAALTHTLTALARHPQLEDIEGEVLQALTEQLGVKWASLFLHDAKRATLYLRTAYGDRKIWSPERLALNVPPPIPVHESPLWQELHQTRKPILVDDTSNDPRLKNRAQILADGIQSVFYVPLVLGDEILGFFSLNSAERRRYSPEEINLAVALAQQVTLAVQINRLAERGKQASLLEERNRMARELHDTLAQGFTGIVVQLEAAEDALRDAPDQAAQHLRRARSLARESLAEARRSVYALRPQALEHKRLPEALRDSARALTASASLNIQVNIADSLPPLPAETEAELLRLAQESITNALRHAHAQTLDISLACHDNRLTLTIADDGRGFDVRAPSNGLGLLGMRERAARIGGELKIESSLGKGTNVICEMTIANERI